MSKIEARLKELGMTLPEPAAPVASYVPFVITGNMVFIAGQLPRDKGQIFALGRVGVDVDITTAQKAAEFCGLNILAHLKVACGGDLDRVERCIKLGGFVASAPDFYDQPKVINGASDLMVNIFGEHGKHSRFAVGVGNLPSDAAVEIDAIFSLKV